MDIGCHNLEKYMENFRSCVGFYFKFLRKYNYVLSDVKQYGMVTWVGKNNSVLILFSECHYEMSCEFINPEDNIFNLQDILNYKSLKEYKGLYQISCKEGLEEGVKYLAKVLDYVFQQIDLSDSENFNEVYKYSVNKRKEMLECYYIEIDLKRAEDFWEQKQYSKAKELFEKRMCNLSKSQVKKLEYIKNMGLSK